MRSAFKIFSQMLKLIKFKCFDNSSFFCLQTELLSNNADLKTWYGRVSYFQAELTCNLNSIFFLSLKQNISKFTHSWKETLQPQNEFEKLFVFYLHSLSDNFGLWWVFHFHFMPVNYIWIFVFSSFDIKIPLTTA